MLEGRSTQHAAAARAYTEGSPAVGALGPAPGPSREPLRCRGRAQRGGCKPIHFDTRMVEAELQSQQQKCNLARARPIVIFFAPPRRSAPPCSLAENLECRNTPRK